MTIIHLSNDSHLPFQGWLPINVDELPDPPVSDNWVTGLRSGLDTFNADVYVGLSPGERQTFHLDGGAPSDYTPSGGFAQMWGGVAVTVAGVALDYLGAELNGAAWDGHWRGRVGRMLNVDLWIHWYPDQAWCPGKVIVTASNPDVPDIKEHIPADFALRFGDADVLIPGLAANAPLMKEGDWLADGQTRSHTLTLCWRRLGGDLDLARAIADQKITANGIKNLHGADGNPHLPVCFDARAWSAAMLPECIVRSTDWFNGPLDQAMVSGASGAQAGQSFIGGPAMADPSAVGPLLIAALDGSWPMHHLEANGEQLNWRRHPGLRLFYGRVNRALSTDTLGKTAEPTSADSHGYKGPEDEHWFIFETLAAARLSGDPALQWHLRAHAIQFLFRYVVEPPGNWLTENRGIGWLSFVAAELYRNLRDRDLADAVVNRYHALFEQLILPLRAGGAWWSWKRSDSIGPGIRAIPWQAAVMALGLSWAGRLFHRGDAQDMALEMGKEIIERAYVYHGSPARWETRDVITADGSDPGPYLRTYDWFGMPMAVAAVLRHEPTHEKARAIWTQLLNDKPDFWQAAWLCPGVEVQ